MAEVLGRKTNRRGIMPQGSLFAQEQLHSVQISVQLDELHNRLVVQVLALNRKGDVLASSGLVLTGLVEAHLAPTVAQLAVTGFLNGTAREAAVEPATWAREVRKRITEG
jgi:hypothetical protein